MSNCQEQINYESLIEELESYDVHLAAIDAIKVLRHQISTLESKLSALQGELREEKIYAINCKLGNVLPSEGEIQKAYCELKEELAEREHAAMKLWIILDDIDTTSDMAKGNDSAYRERVERLQKQRFEVFTSDGYDLFLPDGTKLDPAFPTDERK